MELPPEEERFAANIDVLMTNIYELAVVLQRKGFQSANPMLVDLARNFIKGYDKHQSITNFIKGSHKECWKAIKARDETFLVDNIHNLFSHLPTERLKLFRDLFLATDATGKRVITEEQKSPIWRNFDAMIKISIKYVHKQRLLRGTFLDEIDVKQEAENWGIKL